MAEIDSLLNIMEKLRDPAAGCPWDLQQDMHSLLKYTLEEVYEVVDAIERGDREQIKEELGDLLFQIVFYAQVASENDWFGIQDIVDAISAKLVSRHPHVFPVGDKVASREIQDIHANWEQRKEVERSAKGFDSILDDIPLALPALQRSHKIQSRLARIGFDWQNPREVLQQLRSEIEELEQAMGESDSEACADELGDVLFSCVNLARHLKLDSESCLRATNSKVMKRVAWMERALQAKEDSLWGQSMEALEALWQAAKRDLSRVG